MEQNIFDIAKQKVSIIDVATHILGEPSKSSGSEVYWYSQTHDEKTPSLGADAEKGIITDFSDEDFGKGLDICSFVVQLNNHHNSSKKGFIADKEINNYEALEWINNEFNLDLDLSFKSSPIPTQPQNSTSVKHYSLEATDSVIDEYADGIYAMFDTKEFTEKPTENDMGKIKYRIGANLEPASYSLKGIKREIISGKTCIPSAIKSKNKWIDGENFYQIFMVDIDNVLVEGRKRTNLTTADTRHVSVDEIIKYCESISLVPTFIYYTFSHSEKQHKFRLVYVLHKPTQIQEEVKGVYEYLKEIFKDYNMDTAPTNLASAFYGGKNIAYESDTLYNIKVTEEVGQALVPTQSSETPEMQQIANTCNNHLNYTNYNVWGGKLWYRVNENKATPISNFIVLARNKITYTNGVDNVVKYQLECHLLDNPTLELPLITVDLDAYSNMKFLDGSVWEKHAIISAGRTNADKLKEAMKIISRDTMQEHTVFANTGFERINGKLCYLYHGGVIGDVQNVSVDLADEGLERYCFTDKEFDVKQALKRSLSFLSLADLKITLPILSLIYLAPLTTLLSKNGILADVIIFVQGMSQVGKSTLVGLGLCHYGVFNRNTFPCTFRDTLNSIEKTAYILKDTINVIDDFNPETMGNSKLGTMEKVYGMYGDRAGRRRLTKDAGTKRAYTARGLCIVTGEMIPEVAQSRIARSVIVTIKQNSIDSKKLFELKDHSEELSYSMMKFIRWIIDNEIRVIEYAKATFKEMTTTKRTSVYGRTNEAVSVLWIGFTLFTQFLNDYQVIDIDYKNKLDSEASAVLNELAQSQTQYVADLKPTDIFYDTFEELKNINAIRIINLQVPTSGDYYDKNIVGYYDPTKKVYFLYPDAVYNAVEKHYSNNSNKKFPVNAKTLWRYMAEEGLLDRGKSYEEQNRYTIPKIINGKSGKFLPLKEREKSFDENVEVLGRPLQNNATTPDTTSKTNTVERKPIF